MLSLRILYHRPIALLWGGLVLSAIGDEFFKIALIWLSVSMLGQSAGMIAAVQAAASVTAGLLGGALIDRFRHRHTMLGTDAIRGVFVLLLPILNAFHALTLTALIFITIIVAGLGAFFDPALQASLPLLSSDSRVLQAVNGLFDATRRVARIAGPGLVAAMQGVVPIIHYFTLDALSFLFSLGAVLGITKQLRKNESDEVEPVAERERSGLGQQLGTAFRRVRGDAVMQYMLLGHGVVNGAWYLGLVLSTALWVKQEMRDGIVVYGLVIASYGIGNTLASLILGSVRINQPLYTHIYGRLLASAGFVMLGLAGNSYVMMAGSCIAGWGAPLSNMPFLLELQGKYKDKDIARVFRLRVISESAFVLFALLASPIFYHLLKPADVIVFCGALIGAVGVAGVGLISDVRSRAHAE